MEREMVEKLVYKLLERLSKSNMLFVWFEKYEVHEVFANE